MAVVCKCREHLQGLKIREMFKSWLSKIVHAIVSSFGIENTSTTVEDTCLMMGANTHSTLTDLIENVVVSQRQVVHQTHVGEGIGSPQISCLLCGCECSTLLGLAKHVRRHLIARRCGRMCGTCRDSGLPLEATDAELHSGGDDTHAVRVGTF